MILLDKFAHEWISAWNARDIDKLMHWYADNVEFRSPYVKIVSESGTILNKSDLKKHWIDLLSRNPNISITNQKIYYGDKTVSVHNTDHTGRNVIDTFVFDANDKIKLQSSCFDRTR